MIDEIYSFIYKKYFKVAKVDTLHGEIVSEEGKTFPLYYYQWEWGFYPEDILLKYYMDAEKDGSFVFYTTIDVDFDRHGTHEIEVSFTDSDVADILDKDIERLTLYDVECAEDDDMLLYKLRKKVYENTEWEDLRDCFRRD